MIAASVWQVASEHFLSFTAGVIVGFVLTSRYRIVRVNGKEHRDGDA